MSNVASLVYFTPEFVLIGTILVVMSCDFFATRRPGLADHYTPVAIGGVLLSIITSLILIKAPSGSLFMGMMAHDPLRIYINVVIGIAAILVLIVSHRSTDLDPRESAEFHSLVVALTLGCTLFASATHLLMIYLALEFVSVLSYVLAGFVNVSLPFIRGGEEGVDRSGMRRSAEAALKYVIYGGVASGIMLFGISLIYGLTGTLALAGIRDFLAVHPTDKLLLFVSITLMLAGFGYKIAAFPFHMWCPDVYEGAPTPVAAFLSIAPKGAGFAALIRFFITGFTSEQGDVWAVLKFIEWPMLLAVISAATMTLGNLAALPQRNIKRMLAYSSIAHAGYMLMGLVALNNEGVQAILFYLAVYLVMNLGAFFMVILVKDQFGTEDIDGYKGLGRRAGYGPLYAIVMTLFLLSLTGLPPLAGFIGKFYLFGAVVKSGIIWLAIVGVLNSVVSLYYYIRIVKFMFFDPPPDSAPMPIGRLSHGLVLAGLALATVYLGLFWNPLARATAASSAIWMK